MQTDIKQLEISVCKRIPSHLQSTMDSLQCRTNIYGTLDSDESFKESIGHALGLASTDIQKGRSKDIHALNILDSLSAMGHSPIKCVQQPPQHSFSDSFAKQRICGESTRRIIAYFVGKRRRTV